MSLSIPEICNMALAAVGHTQFIDNINERTEEAVVCKLFYNNSKQQMLRDTRPSFARQTIQLSKVADKPSDEWLYAYRQPSTALKVLYIPTIDQRLQSRVPFDLGANSTQKLIYTNKANAQAVVVVDVDESLFGSMFADLLSLHLATKLAMPLSIELSIQAAVMERYMLARDQAMTAIANEMQLSAPPESELVSGYYGYGYDTNEGRM